MEGITTLHHHSVTRRTVIISSLRTIRLTWKLAFHNSVLPEQNYQSTDTNELLDGLLPTSTPLVPITSNVKVLLPAQHPPTSQSSGKFRLIRLIDMPKETESELSLSVQAASPQPHTPPRPKPLTRLHSKITAKLSKTFRNFSDLPTEIRLQIWEATFPGPRIHELHPCGKLDMGRLMFRSNSSAPPVVLHVCRESRYLALQHFELMDYDPSFPAKPVRKFYFNPWADTLFLNTLTALYMTLILLEDHESAARLGIMKGWQNVAFDADRAHLVTLLSGVQGRAPRPQFQRVFPSLRQLTIAFDFTRKGKTRFRTSVWPGENGTSLAVLRGNTSALMGLFEPIREDLRKEFEENQENGRVIEMRMANVKRKVFIRGNIRYGFRKSCAFFGLRPRGVFRWL